MLRGLNPLVAEPTTSNPDGDFMAKVEIGKSYALLSFANADGKTMMYALPNNGAGFVDANGGLAEAATNESTAATGIPVFRYGDETGPLVPTSRGSWVKSDEITSVAGTSYTTTYYEYTCTEKPTAPKPIDWTGLDDIANATVLTGQTLVVIHDQVMAE